MVHDGFFDRFPCDAIFAIHNIPTERETIFSTTNCDDVTVDNWEIEIRAPTGRCRRRG